MSTRESDTATTIVSISAIAAIVSVACYFGYDHTLIKLGIAAVAGLGGFSLNALIRRNHP